MIAGAITAGGISPDHENVFLKFCLLFLFPQLDEVYKALEKSANQLTSGQLRSVVPRREIKVSTVDEFQVSLLVI